MLFIRYSTIAALLALAAMALMALVEYVWRDSKEVFAIATTVVYGVGILASYHLQARFTFQSKHTSKGLSKFVLVAFAASVTTTLVATSIRFGLPWSNALLSIAAPVSFAVGCAVSGCASFFLNKNLVFGEEQV